MAGETVYECQNESCALGARGVPGRFTGGASKELITTLTGDPEPEVFGEGICPACGTKGKKVGTEEPSAGSDPNQEFHDQIAARVADPADGLRAEGAQAELLALVEPSGEEGEEE